MRLDNRREARFMRRMTVEVFLLVLVALLFLVVVARAAAPSGDGNCKIDGACERGSRCVPVKTGCPGAESYSTCASRRCVPDRAASGTVPASGASGK